MTILVDSSVLLDVLAPSTRRDWSARQLGAAASMDELAINQVIYAELAPGFSSREALERVLQGIGLRRLALPWASSWVRAQE